MLPNGLSSSGARSAARLGRDDPRRGRGRARHRPRGDHAARRGRAGHAACATCCRCREVLLVESTGNRPDLLSVYGIAREVAALYDLELAQPPGHDPGHVPERAGRRSRSRTSTAARATSAGCSGTCDRPVAVWLKSRLLAAGMRPISNVVDVTNYVMLALGNPLHAFDLSTLAGGRIVVRRARAGERLRTLDGVDRALDAGRPVIADAERAVALAGIMGGEETEIGERRPTSSSRRRTSSRTGSSAPPSACGCAPRLEPLGEGRRPVPRRAGREPRDAAARRVPARAGSAHADVHGELPERPVITYRPERADAVIGIETPPEEQHALLEPPRLRASTGSEVSRRPGAPRRHARGRRRRGGRAVPARGCPVHASCAARDVRHADSATAAAPPRRGRARRASASPRRTRLHCAPRTTRRWKLPEPISADLAVLRTRCCRASSRRPPQRRAGAERIALFEIARVYLPDGELPDEHASRRRDRRGRLVHGKGIVETLYAALKAEPAFERDRRPAFHPGKAARTEPGSSASCTRA